MQQHVDFFDRDGDGIISMWDTFLGYVRSMGGFGPASTTSLLPPSLPPSSVLPSAYLFFFTFGPICLLTPYSHFPLPSSNHTNTASAAWASIGPFACGQVCSSPSARQFSLPPSLPPSLPRRVLSPSVLSLLSPCIPRLITVFI